MHYILFIFNDADPVKKYIDDLSWCEVRNIIRMYIKEGAIKAYNGVTKQSDNEDIIICQLDYTSYFSAHYLVNELKFEFEHLFI